MRSPLAFRVSYADTDGQRGHVHHASFYRWLDSARAYVLRSLGAQSLERELVTRLMTLEYIQPLDYDDVIRVYVTIDKTNPRPQSSITFTYTVFKGDNRYIPAATGRQVMVRISDDGVPVELNQHLRQRLEEALNGQ